MENDAKMALDKILSTDADKIRKSFLEGLFAGYHDKATNTFKEPNFLTTTVITLTPEQYPHIKEPIETTLGTLVFNRYVLESINIIDKVGYWNIPLDEDGLSALNTRVNGLIIAKQLTTEDLGHYIDHRDQMGFWCSSFLSVSFTSSLMRPMEEVEKRKKELVQQYDKEINSDNPTTQIMSFNKIEKELTGMAQKLLETDSGYDLYRSGSANFKNNYKCVNIICNPVYNDMTKKYDIVPKSLMNGLTKYDIPAYSNIVVAGAYPSAVGTAEAGYMSKIVIALMQSVKIDENPDSDCGTSATIPLYISKKYARYFIDRYINDNGKKVFLTNENISNYVGQTVNMYTPQGCLNKEICGKCGGKVFHNLGVKNVGLLVTQFTMKLLNLKLKSKHDLSQSADIIPINMLFSKNTTNCVVDNGILKTNVPMKMFIPKVMEEIGGFVKEATILTCMGVFPVKFYDKSGNEIESNIMTFPCQVDFNLYSDPQEDPDNFIVSYEAGSEICNTAIRQSIVNVEYFLNQIYLNSNTPQLPYHMMTNMMFRCMELNKVDLTVSSIVYEMLARRVCRSGNDTFAFAYGRNPNIDPMSYEKLNFRTAVQEAGILQGVLFQDISKSINVGLSQSLDGIKPEETPFEQIIKA